MRPGRQEVLARERRWALPVALATFAGVALLIAATIAMKGVGGGEAADFLTKVHAHPGKLSLSTVLEAAGFVLLAAPLAYLFRATRARSERVRGPLLAAVVAAPLFMAVATGLSGVATSNAASDYAAGDSSPSLSGKEATGECESERKDRGAKEFGEEFEAGPGGPAALGRCVERKLDNDSAENAIAEASPRNLAIGFAMPGRLGLAFAFVYTSLWAMRTGLLTRFWGSLGIALGIASLFPLVQFTLVWFLYFGLLAAGWVPGGKPPAWVAGEAIPWPTPGERAAEALRGEGEAGDEPPIEGEAAEVGAGGPPSAGERRKRKRRT